MQLYSDQELLHELNSISGWVIDNGSIKKDFVFKNFKEALGFVVQVGIISEILDHHAEIWNVYNKVVLKLNTHSANAITSKDIDMAKQINTIIP